MGHRMMNSEGSILFFTGVNSLAVYVNWFGQFVGPGTKLFSAYSADDPSNFGSHVDINVARIHVITEWAVKLLRQWLQIALLDQILSL